MKYIIFALVFASSCLNKNSDNEPVTDEQGNQGEQGSVSTELTFKIDAGTANHTISPLIYGTNDRFSTDDFYSFYRFGGNRHTGYNWENNWSSAGIDWFNSNDGFLIPEDGDASEPALSYKNFVNRSLSLQGQVLLTVPLAGYVAADGNGEVSEAETAPSSRWIPVYPEKDPVNLSLEPDLNDNAVYINELVHLLVNTYGTSSEGGVLAYSLDNEPALWADTHPRLHPNRVLAEDLVEKSIETAKAVKEIDNSALIFGPALYGFAAYLNLQDAPDWSGTLYEQYSWFIDFYLDNMKSAEDEHGKRLLDVLDLHWYPEARGDSRIISASANTENDRRARLQAPRSLWDSEYKENSWISSSFSNYLPLIPRVQQSIDEFYPGTKLAFTEYHFGGGDHITGGLAQADLLGIFGKYNIYAASIWSYGSESQYINLAFQLFKDYDGLNSSFGDISINAEIADKKNTSIYAAINSSTDNLHIVVINKQMDQEILANFNIASLEVYQTMEVYRLSENEAAIENLGNISLGQSDFSYALSPLSAYHLVLSK